MKTQARVLLLLAIVLAAPNLTAQMSDNVELLGHVPFAAGQTGDIWASGNYVFVARRTAGLSIVDVSDPRNPQIVFEQDFGLNQDVKVSGKYAFLTNEQRGDPVGVIILDISDPPNTRVVSTIATPEIRSVHNVYTTGDYLYVVSNSSGDVRIFDVSDPASPVEVGLFEASFGFPHDITVIGDLMYAAFLSGGFHIVDVTDRRRPIAVRSHDYSGAVTHNIWPARNGRFVLTTDETINGHVRIWDVGGLIVAQAGEFMSKPNIIVHNVLADRDLAYISYYVDGLQIIDIRDPRRPQRVGFYDTFAGSDSAGFQGAWGVYPYGEQIYVSDVSSGLYVLEFSGRKTGRMAGRVLDARTGAAIAGAKIEAIEKPVSTFTDRAGDYELTTTVDTLRVVFSSRGYLADTLQVVFAEDQETQVDVALQPELLTSVEEENPVTPRAFALQQNYPNPYNPTTRISYLVPEDGVRVRLQVFNIRGEQVATLVDSRQNAGEHTVVFDGSGLPSGVYVYRLEIWSAALSLTESKKMILAR